MLLLPALLLTTLAAAAAVPAECPKVGRDQILRAHPEQLLPCAQSTDPIDWVWAAQALGATGRQADAADLLERAANSKSLAPIRTILLIESARSEINPEKAEHGLTLLNSISEAYGWLTIRLQLARSQLFLAAGQPEKALHAARVAATSRGPNNEAAWRVAAEAAAAIKDAKATTEATRTLAVEYPSSADNVALPAADYGLRWNAWIAHGGADGVAKECVERVGGLKGKPIDLGRARLSCARALATIHSDAAAKVFQSAAKVPDVRADALLGLARLAGRDKDAEKIAKLCKQIDATKATDQDAECWFLAAFVRWQNSDKDAAHAGLKDVLKRFPKHTRAEDAAWFLAFDTLNTPEAPAAFDTLVKWTHKSGDTARALYWRGGVNAPTDEALAKKDWKETQRIDPYGYYGWLASVRLGELGVAATTRDDPCTPPFVPLAEPPKGAEVADLLLRTGLQDYARQEIASALGYVGNPRGWTDFLAGAGQWKRVADLGTPYPRAYPQAFIFAEPVDRCLVLSLMQRESRYDPEVTSAAQAVGLLQLLPKTAAKLARELKLPAPSAADLHDPAVNVKLGAHYVARLLQRFGNPLVVAAAYNAGPGAVAEWIGKNHVMPLDEWVERIPFRETRNYVKAVGATYAHYRLTYAGALPVVDFAPVAATTDGIDY